MKDKKDGCAQVTSCSPHPVRRNPNHYTNEHEPAWLPTASQTIQEFMWDGQRKQDWVA